jgi:integrase
LVVLFLAYTGVRFGELAALKVGRLELVRRRAVIAESVTTVHGAGKGGGELVFPGVRGGGALRATVFRRAAFDEAAAAIGLPGLHPHELRHTAASLAIAAGADVKVFQQMLGHASAAMTLDRYGHLSGDRLDQVAAALDVARAADVYPTCTRAEIEASEKSPENEEDPADQVFGEVGC